MQESEQGVGIAAVERESGLSKDVLRVWERRYGFPSPQRDPRGERIYPPGQVRRLRLLKRLMDQGHRPGRLLALPEDELERLAAGASAARAAAPCPAAGALPGAAGAVLQALRAHDVKGVATALRQQLALRGLASFVQDILAPLAVEVGEEWARGGLQVFEEHLFTETCTRVLRQAIAALPAGAGPVVLLTTVPDESHGLGLLMVEGLLALHGARCVALGTAMPVADIARAAQVYGADVVALSFSSAFAARRLPEVLCQLRAALPAGVAVWAGGAGVRRLPPLEGVRSMATLADALAALQAWPGRG